MAQKHPTRLEKVPEDLLRMIDEAMKARIVNNIDQIGRRYQNYPRFMRAISRHQQLREDLKKSKFVEDERK